MRLRIAGVAAVAVLTGLLAGCAEDAIEDGFDGGPVSGDGFELVLPEGWGELTDEATGDLKEGVDDEVEEELGGPVDFEVGGFYSRREEDGFSTNANVTIEQVTPSIDTEAYADITVRNLERAGYELVSGPDPAKLGDEPALSLDFTREADGNELKQRGVTAVVDGKGYSVVFTALEDEFENEEGDFDEILSSFEFTGS